MTSKRTCPRCGYPGRDPRAVRAGRMGGSVKCRKGFSVNREALAKAVATRARGRKVEKS